MASPRAGSPTPQEVADELRRVVERWPHALAELPAVRAQSLADRVAASRDVPRQRVPDLGPAVVMDQLTVMVHDLYRAEPHADPAAVAEQLAGIRRSL